MGRGDKRTKRGKITIGSFGKSRPRKVNKVVMPAAADNKTAPEAPKEGPKKKAASRKKDK